MEYLYHGSSLSELKKLIPIFREKNAFKEKVTCYSTSFIIALLYIRKYTFHWISFVINEETGTIDYNEVYPNMLEDLYKGISGSVYFVEKENPTIKLSRFKNMYISYEPILPIKEIFIDDVYNEILNFVDKGLIIVNHYNTLTEEKRNVQEKNIFSAIIKERLIVDPWDKSE